MLPISSREAALALNSVRRLREERGGGTGRLGTHGAPRSSPDNHRPNSYKTAQGAKIQCTPTAPRPRYPQNKRTFAHSRGLTAAPPPGIPISPSGTAQRSVHGALQPRRAENGAPTRSAPSGNGDSGRERGARAARPRIARTAPYGNEPRPLRQSGAALGAEPHSRALKAPVGRSRVLHWTWSAAADEGCGAGRRDCGARV